VYESITVFHIYVWSLGLILSIIGTVTPSPLSSCLCNRRSFSTLTNARLLPI